MRVLSLVLAAGIVSCNSFGDAAPSAPDDAGSSIQPSTDGGADATGAVDASGADAPSTGPGPIAYWKMDETGGTVARDSASNHDGAITGAGKFVPGEVGNAFSTENGSGFISVPNHPSLLVTNALTVALWLSLSSSVEDSYIYAHGAQFALKLNARRPQLQIGGGYASTVYELAVNEWHHLAVTFASGTTHIYIDGVEAPAGLNAASTPMVAPDGNPIVIGRTAEGANPALGLIDDLRVWNRALSSDEIKALVQ